MEEYTEKELEAFSELLPSVAESRDIDDDNYDKAAPVDFILNEDDA